MKFYGIAALNGYGVYTDYKRLCETLNYASNCSFRKFKYYHEAEDYAENTYRALQLRVFGHVHNIEKIEKENWFYRPLREAAGTGKIKPFIIVDKDRAV